MDWEIKPSRAHKPDPKKPKKSQKTRRYYKMQPCLVQTCKYFNVNKTRRRSDGYVVHRRGSEFDWPSFVNRSVRKIFYKMDCTDPDFLL